MTTTRDNPRTWLNQFGSEYQVPQEITEKFADISWGNDACPAFTHTGSKDDDWGGWRLWVEHPDLAKREFPDDSKRFIVVFDRLDEGTSEPMLETDDLQEAVKYFKRVDGLQVVVGGSVWFKGAEVVLPPQDRPQRQLVYVREDDGVCVVSISDENSRNGLLTQIARVPLTDAQKAWKEPTDLGAAHCLEVILCKTAGDRIDQTELYAVRALAREALAMLKEAQEWPMNPTLTRLLS